MEKENVSKVGDSPAQKVLIVGSVNPDVNAKIKQIADEMGLELVVLTDNVVTDYLKAKGVDVKDALEVTVEQFLSDESNRKIAQEKAAQLWTILTKRTDVENSALTIFTETQTTRATSLSHKEFQELAELLRAFGFFEWIDLKKREYRLIFDKSFAYKMMKQDVISVVKLVNNDILRYKNAIKADCNLTEEQRSEMLKQLAVEVNLAIQY